METNNLNELEKAQKKIAELEKLVTDKDNKLQEANAIINNLTEIASTAAKEHELLTAIMNNIPVNINVKDIKTGKYLFWNKNSETEIGISSNDAVGKTDYDIFQKEQADYFRSTDKMVAQKKKTITINEQLIESIANGTLIFNAIKIPLFYYNSEPQTILGISLNINKYKSIEKSLHKIEKKYRGLFEEAPIGIFKTTFEGKISDLNHFLAKMLGYNDTKEAIDLIKNISENMYAFKEDRSAFINMLKKHPDYARYETKFRRKDGSTFLGIMTTKLIMDKNNKPKSIYGFIEDITEQKFISNALKDSEEKFRKIIELSSDGIILMNADGDVIEWNKGMEELTGVTKDEAIKKKIRNIKYDLKPSYYTNIDSINYFLYFNIDTKNISDAEWLNKSFELDIVHASGKTKTIHVVSYPLEIKKSIMIASIARDITDDKINENSLKRAIETKDMFFSIIAHGIRNPLSELIHISKELAENFNNITLKDMENITQIFYLSSSNLFEYLDNLLQWSSSQIGAINIRNEEIHLSMLLNEICLIYKSMSEVKNIIIERIIPNDIIIKTDKNILSTVLRNVISNAIKYSNLNSKIHITARISEKTLINMSSNFEILIEDFGVGMSDESIKKMYKLDMRFSTPGTMNESGTGLGLILSKDLIEKVNGMILVKSELGKGSIFTIVIPKLN